MTSISEQKSALRREAGRIRKTYHAASGPPAALAARDRLLALSEMTQADAVSVFWPVGSEIDTRPLLHALAGRQTVVGLPVVAGRNAPLVFRQWMPDTGMIDGAHDIPTPPPDAPVIVPDVLVVPLLAFDRKGYRLGYGGGYYDRTLSAARSSGRAVLGIGYAYAVQEVDAVAREAFDQPLDLIVTDKETIRPHAEKQ